MMTPKPKRNRLGHPFGMAPRWRWLIWPVLGASMGGVALSVWADEEAIGLTDCLPLAALPALAALLYGFSALVFRSIESLRDVPREVAETPAGGRRKQT